MKYFTQCFIYLIALILSSVLTYSVVALAVAPINVEKPLISHSIALESWLDKLEMCESSGKAHIKVFDSNNEYSYGAYQFQFLTIKHYVKKFGWDVEEAEIQNVIYDKDFQRNLAREIITKEKDGWRNWYNCSLRYGRPPTDSV